MTIPNIISLFRFGLVPVVIMAMMYGRMDIALAGFIVAGASDAIDGYIARQFGQVSELGKYLDPIADKTLLVSVFVMLGYLGELPGWLVILVVSRDAFIVGGVILQSVMGDPMEVNPLFVSKANTLCQIMLAVVVLSGPALGIDQDAAESLLIMLTALLTLLSGAAYLMTWWRFVGPTDGTRQD